MKASATALIILAVGAGCVTHYEPSSKSIAGFYPFDYKGCEGYTFGNLTQSEKNEALLVIDIITKQPQLPGIKKIQRNRVDALMLDATAEWHTLIQRTIGHMDPPVNFVERKLENSAATEK